MSSMNFKRFRTLDVLNALKFKKLIDASLTALDAVNEASFILPLSSQIVLKNYTLKLRCTYVRRDKLFVSEGLKYMRLRSSTYIHILNI